MAAVVAQRCRGIGHPRQEPRGGAAPHRRYVDNGQEVPLSAAPVDTDRPHGVYGAPASRKSWGRRPLSSPAAPPNTWILKTGDTREVGVAAVLKRTAPGG